MAAGQLETHLQIVINAYNFGRRLKTLHGLTPYEYICKIWASISQWFKLNPIRLTPNAGIKRTTS